MNACQYYLWDRLHNKKEDPDWCNAPSTTSIEFDLPGFPKYKLPMCVNCFKKHEEKMKI